MFLTAHLLVIKIIENGTSRRCWDNNQYCLNIELNMLYLPPTSSRIKVASVVPLNSLHSNSLITFILFGDRLFSDFVCSYYRYMLCIVLLVHGRMTNSPCKCTSLLIWEIRKGEIGFVAHANNLWRPLPVSHSVWLPFVSMASHDHISHGKLSTSTQTCFLLGR